MCMTIQVIGKDPTHGDQKQKILMVVMDMVPSSVMTISQFRNLSLDTHYTMKTAYPINEFMWV